MVRRDRTTERLVALFLLGAVLLLPPVLLLFNRPERVLGIPILYLYLFAAWALLITLSAALSRRLDAGAEAPSTADPGGGDAAPERRDA